MLRKMNQFGSEGPSAKERSMINDQSEHGLLMASLNKDCLNTAMPYVATTKADVAIVHKINQKRQRLFVSKANMTAWSYMSRHDGTKVPSCRMEGSPSIEGPNGDNSGGAAILIRPHIGMSVPKFPSGSDCDPHNLCEIMLGHVSAMVVNAWTRTRLLAINIYMDVCDQRAPLPTLRWAIGITHPRSSPAWGGCTR